ncbi:MAG: hypothetical protein ACREKK_00460 [Candidatus Methylomirabilales bacterium]
MAKIEVISRQDVFSPNPQRVGRLDKLVVYRVDTDPTRTFFVTIPAEEFTEAKEMEEIRKAERERVLTKPRTFEL